MKFGLIGYPLGHSFSKDWFTNKFEALGLTSFSYELFPLQEVEEVYDVLHRDVFGLNVTLPYKTTIINYLNEIDSQAWKIGAVNTLVRTGPNSWKGFNTDISGFREALMQWLHDEILPTYALVLGTGGASRAISAALYEMGVGYTLVSSSGNGDIGYQDLTREIMEQHLLIINTTPLGMTPDTAQCPDIPYMYLTPRHYLFDLVYNPANTLFLTRGTEHGARIQNGLRMLHIQAEHAWTIWKSYGKF